eukprot:scaffold314_cov562-Prasinococcus_capsulatus_cf.AAC.5
MLVVGNYQNLLIFSVDVSMIHLCCQSLGSVGEVRWDIYLLGCVVWTEFTPCSYSARHEQDAYARMCYTCCEASSVT